MLLQYVPSLLPHTFPMVHAVLVCIDALCLPLPRQRALRTSRRKLSSIPERGRSGEDARQQRAASGYRSEEARAGVYMSRSFPSSSIVLSLCICPRIRLFSTSNVGPRFILRSTFYRPMLLMRSIPDTCPQKYILSFYSYLLPTPRTLSRASIHQACCRC